MSQDGDSKGKVAAFVTNGGGTVTFRFLLMAVMGVTVWLIQQFGSHMVEAQDQFGKQQARMANSIATLAQQMADTAKVAGRSSDRLDDHEHRITILEVRSGH